ncbi:MAG: glycosyltransferase [Spirochaetaceae bacterium]|nr:MAG: glycosyltransferase [Spirochaetaceae bacterium]
MKQPPERWWMVLPGPLDRCTGGTIYDRRVVEAARAAGDSVTVVSLPGAFPMGLAQADRDACRRELAALPDDATACVDGLVLAALHDELLQLTQRCRMLLLIHHPTSEEPGLDHALCAELWRRESAVIGAADHVICTSAFTARQLISRGVAAENVSVAPPGVDLPPQPAPDYAARRAQQNRGAPGRPLRLLCVANLIERKGLAYLLQALEDLRELQWQLTIVGSAELEPQTAERLQRDARRRGLEGRVRFAGPQSADALQRLYSEAELFVLPSLWEGYGMVLTEAAAHALPIVTTNGGAIPDTVAGLAAVVVTAADAPALTAALRPLLSDAAQLSALRERAQGAVAGLQPWHAAAAEFRRILHMSASEHSGGFDRQWLALREPADHAARDETLCTRLGAYLRRRVAPSPRTLRVVDLAGGTGSNLRFLAPRLQLPQHWTLYDIDPVLLDYGRRQCLRWIRQQRLSGQIELSACVVDLAREIPIGANLDCPDLVTSSALLDLVSRAWLVQLVERLCACDPRPALLAATIYCGGSRFYPPDDQDNAVMAAFETDMRRDKGFGAALGSNAVGEASGLLAAAGFSVTRADSSWKLDGALCRHIGSRRFTALLERQLAFFASAALQQGVDISGWLQRRRASLHDGTLQARIAHSDILALAPARHDLLR